MPILGFFTRSLTGILVGALIAAAALLSIQTARLNACQAKARLLDTCEEVDKLETEIRDETDDALTDRLSDPDRVRDDR